MAKHPEEPTTSEQHLEKILKKVLRRVFEDISRHLLLAEILAHFSANSYQQLSTLA